MRTTLLERGTVAPELSATPVPVPESGGTAVGVEIVEGRYIVRLARDRREVESALRLRFDVFAVELGGKRRTGGVDELEFDEFDFVCDHLVVIDRDSGRTVGTYRLNTLENAGSVDRLYSYCEFTIEHLPADVLTDGIEIGRACVAHDHRNSRVLFLLWRGLAAYMLARRKRFFFGCCSIFSRDPGIGAAALFDLATRGLVDDSRRVHPRWCDTMVRTEGLESLASPELPALFEMYLRVGAKVCGGPILDREFGTIDFFVVCDSLAVPERYRRLLFSR